MPDSGLQALHIVDALELDPATRGALRPDHTLVDEQGRQLTLPRYFYEVPTWEIANEVRLVEHFTLAEFMRVDVREAVPLRDFPRYVPCAVSVLAAHLELLRLAADAPVFIAANGGYRSPAHKLTRHASTHCWGTAANVYRIGDAYLDSRERIERWNELARRSMPGVWTRPYGHGPGCADDHIHVDLGHVVSVPRNAGSETPAS